MKELPKDRLFLGLIKNNYEMYWELVIWTKDDDGEEYFSDKDLHEVDEIIQWHELPKIRER